jgi:hypothetical protein
LDIRYSAAGPPAIVAGAKEAQGMGQTDETGESESLQALYSQLVEQLRKAKIPAQWWLARHQVIAMLKRNAPRLFEALTAHYRLVAGRAAGRACAAASAPERRVARGAGGGPWAAVQPGVIPTRGDPIWPKRALGAAPFASGRPCPLPD